MQNTAELPILLSRRWTRPRVTFFEIPADNPQRAIKFYEQVFGWKIDKWGSEDYWLITTGPDAEPGINGRITLRSTAAHVTDTVSVPNLDEAVSKVVASGGKVAVPKMPVPTMGWLAYCTDTEGNLFSMIQNDPSAK
jgi:uncharacterized protein